MSRTFRWFPIAYFGILKAGGVVVPLNVLLKPREIAYHLKDSDAKALIVFEGTPELPMAQMARAACDEVRGVAAGGDAGGVHRIAGPGRNDGPGSHRGRGSGEALVRGGGDRTIPP